MRQHGDPAASNLFLHEGNYFGTWQRIDIPLFIDTEYCLLLDSDTLLTKPFTLADFGLNLTRGIAMSSEINFDEKVPSNAGVTLIEGHAHIEGPNEVSVGAEHYTCERILIATGGWPMLPDIPGAEHMITSNEVFDLETLPKRALVLGGGYIAVEYYIAMHVKSIWRVEAEVKQDRQL